MDDAISRKGVSAWLYNMGHEKLSGYILDENRFPSIQSERKTGKWIFLEPNGFKCSECSRYLYIACGDVKMNFCPHCNADMRGDSDD